MWDRIGLKTDQNWTKNELKLDYFWSKPLAKSFLNLDLNWVKVRQKLD